MDNNQIQSLAREYAEEIRKDFLLFFPQPLPESMELLIKNDQIYYGQFLQWLLRRYCLVEKEKLDNIYQGILVQLDPKNFGYSPYNQGRMDLLKSIFPEIAKEAEV